MAYSITIDIHGETRQSVRKLLENKLKSLSKDTREVIVIHGYHQGNTLQQMVRSFKHPMVERKILGLNQGETIFLIKK